MKEKFKLLAICLICATLLSACNNDTNISEKPDKIGNTKADLANQMSIYLCKAVIGDYFKEAIDEFNKNNKGVQIVSKNFEGSEDFAKKVTIELQAGAGPDIVTFNTNTFNSIHRTVESQVFYDLNSLISEDKGFKLSDYNEKVMEAGVFSGKRYIMPITYAINVLTTTKEKLDRDKFSIGKSGGMTWKEILEVSNRYMNTKNNKFFFSYMYPMVFLETSGTNFVDVDNKKANFKCSEFIEILNTYKTINSAAIPDEQQRGKDFDYIDSRSLVGLDNRFMGKDITLEYKMGNKIVYPIEMPEMKGKVAATPFYMVGINSHCKDKNAAFDYIKLLLSEKMQVSSNLHLVPVNKAAFMSDKKEESNEYNALAIKLSKNIGKCEISENKIYGIIIRELNDFLNNKKTAEQTAAVIQDKVNIFLNE